MKGALTPEEKLLRLIRGQKTEKLSLAANSLFSGFLAFWNLWRGLLFIFFFACVYLAIALARPLFTSNKPLFLNKTAKIISEEKISAGQEIKPYEFYSDAIKNKQIFTRATSKEQEVNTGVIIGDDLVKDLNLVGIVSGNNPQAVIEDKRTQKTYYAVKDQFVGNFQIKDIQEGKIIISSGGKEFELCL